MVFHTIEINSRKPVVFRLVTIVVFAALVCATAWVWHTWTAAWSADDTGVAREQVVRIPTGATLPAVTDSLVKQGLLHHPRMFKIVARLTGEDRRVQAGRYAIPTGLSPRDVLQWLVSGRTMLVRITLPEGITASEVADIVAGSLHCSAEGFLVAADSIARTVAISREYLGDQRQLAHYDSLMKNDPRDIPRALHWSEGYLAPDTYHFAEGTPPAVIAATIVELGMARLDSINRNRTAPVDDLALTPHQLLTLASVVEAEARKDEERSQIAAVYINRLRKGWRLEADPCVAYLLHKKGRRLLYKDLTVASPYNTYRHAGLPPGPIGSPGLPSLQAAAAPHDNQSVLFFVSDSEGGHVFSSSREEHEQAVREYREKRRQSAR